MRFGGDVTKNVNGLLDYHWRQMITKCNENLTTAWVK